MYVYLLASLPHHNQQLDQFCDLPINPLHRIIFPVIRVESLLKPFIPVANALRFNGDRKVVAIVESVRDLFESFDLGPVWCYVSVGCKNFAQQHDCFGRGQICHKAALFFMLAFSLGDGTGEMQGARAVGLFDVWGIREMRDQGWRRGLVLGKSWWCESWWYAW